MSIQQKIAISAFEKKYGKDIEVQHGTHVQRGEVAYLVVQPKNKEDVFSYYLLDRKSYKFVRKICGCINSYENKENNSKCIFYSGWGDHKGVGYCRKHKRKEGFENKFKRKYMSDLLQTGRGKAPIYINLLKAVESQPFETEKELESLFWNLLTAFISQIQGMSHYVDDVVEEEVEGAEKKGKKEKKKLTREKLETRFGQSFVNDYKAMNAYTRQLESLANSIATLRREIHFSPVQIFKWLDEARVTLEGVFGVSVAQEAMYHIITVKGLLNKTELKEGVVIDAAFMEKEKSFLAALPLGYGNRIEEADFEDIVNGKKNGEKE